MNAENQQEERRTALAVPQECAPDEAERAGFSQSRAETELLALYRTADVMLVTPLRDGMNLVAKEFIACRHDDDGVLERIKGRTFCRGLESSGQGKQQ